METVLLYLAKSTAILLLFYVVYFFLLKKETFFSSNRWFLLLGIFSSISIPFLAFKKIVWIEPVKTTLKNIDFNSVAMTTFETIPVEESRFSWEMLLVLIYGIGVLVFLSKLIIEFYSLRKIIKHKTKKLVDGFKFIEVDEAVSPFSFFKTIVYNPTLFQVEELDNIIKHEKIHAKQNHSVDVLITRIYCILFWWNPLVWMYKKAIIQNLEFIADHNALAQANDKKSYLLTLLKITTAERHVAITNHFYQSLIKKRIVMLNKNQSNRWNSWKYAIIIPVLAFFIMTYQVKVVAQVKSVQKTAVDNISTLFEMKINSASKNEEIYKQVKYLQTEFGIKLKFDKISRNKVGEIIAIDVTLSDENGNKKVYDVSTSEPIKEFTIFINRDKNKQQTFGFGATKENQHLKDHFVAVEKFEKTAKSKNEDFTKKQELKTNKVNNNNDMSFKTSDSNDNISLIKEDKNIDYTKAYISLNGKEITPIEMEKIDPNSIESVSTINSPNKDKLIAKYGEKARNGVILIETKNFKESAPAENKWKVSTETFKLDKENGGVIVHKRSQKSNFEFIQKELEKIGVIVKISGIERNKDGFITEIKVKLIDNERNHKMSENWVTSKNPNGIPDISIGRKNGKLKLQAL